ncbi:MAG: chemotaxis protein CheW [Nitrosomonas sp.]|nr:chemotaxis protein CheW [Nitrosomonas sp.]
MTKENDITENGQEALETEIPVADTVVLGMMIGDVRYLVRMKEISEVIQVTEIVPVPLTHPWFLGIINVHGNLYGITDLGVYLGGEFLPFDFRSRILLVSSNYRINSGFIVHNLLGIRSLSEFETCQTCDEQLRSGVSHVYQDKEGRTWYELNLCMFVREKRFLQIAS